MKQEPYLIFKISGELFAIPVDKIIEVIELEDITPVPETPEYIKGITNFRGSILAVIDMRKKFNIPKIKKKDDDVMIVLDLMLKNKKVTFGAIVDSVSYVEEFNFIQITKLPEIGTKFNTTYIDGIVNHENNYIVLLNLEKIFSVDEITIINESGLEKKQETFEKF